MRRIPLVNSHSLESPLTDVLHRNCKAETYGTGVKAPTADLVAMQTEELAPSQEGRVLITHASTSHVANTIFNSCMSFDSNNGLLVISA